MAGELSVGQQQMLEIAKSLATDAKLIVMDEPTAALTDREIESLFKVIASLKEKHVSIIYISHRKKFLRFAIALRFYGMAIILEQKKSKIPHLKELSK